MIHNFQKYIIFYYVYTQSFVIIKKEKIVDSEIDFDDSKILCINDTNHIFQEYMQIFSDIQIEEILEELESFESGMILAYVLCNFYFLIYMKLKMNKL